MGPVTKFDGQVVGPDLSCLVDCFPAESDPGYCITSLLQDVIARGTCKEYTSEIWKLPTGNCTIGPQTCVNPWTPGCISSDYISSGTCSEETEMLLKTGRCIRTFKQLPPLLHQTVTTLRRASCRQDPNIVGRKKGRTQGKEPDPRTRSQFLSRLAPVAAVTPDVKTELGYTHTRHRYPWICSLRTRGVNSEHLCAVSLLSVPPQPTVVVGAAHCTYLCKDGKTALLRLSSPIIPILKLLWFIYPVATNSSATSTGITLSSCCCDPTQSGCKEDKARCGRNPLAVKMDGSDVDILCGEWETGTTPQEFSDETYNVDLPILEIIRHQDFDAAKEGPAAGSDIAVFIVNDGNLAESDDKIYPVCLPLKNRQKSRQAVHSGRSKPPPLHFLQEYAKGFVTYFSDFFKQWNYKMDIQESCKDPKSSYTKSTYNTTTDQFTSTSINTTTDTYYPPGLICAKEQIKSVCFTPGDSGSPLMAREKDRPDRFYMEGLLSFTKGCDLLRISQDDTKKKEFYLAQRSENPAAYTKLSCFLPWVAQQYGLSYDGDPATDESCSWGRGQKKPTQPCRGGGGY